MRVPNHLKDHGADLWRTIQHEYSITDAGGLAMLTIAAECLDRMRQAQAEIDANGCVLDDRYGGKKPNPACAIEKDSRNGLLAALRGLNLDLEPLRDKPGNPGFEGFGVRSVS